MAESLDILTAELADMLARGIRQVRNGGEPTAWRPDEVDPGR